MDKDKVERMNSFSTTIRENLIISLPMPSEHALVDGNTTSCLIPAPSFSLLTNQAVEEKVNELKANKLSGPAAHQSLTKTSQISREGHSTGTYRHLQLQYQT